MGKIAVFRSIGRGYSFGFGHFGTALTICWLPFALTIAAAVFLLFPAIGSLLQNFPQVFPHDLTTLDDPQKNEAARQFVTAFAGFYRQIILFGLICLLLRAMVAVGLTRASAGLEEGEGFFYFSLGSAVWKLFGAWIATFLILYAAQVILTVIAVVVGVIACLALMKVSIVAAIGVGVLLYLALVCAIIYIKVRLNFFLPPIIVSEKKLDILRSWTLSEGNFWRIVAIYIGIGLPFIVLLLAADAAVFTLLWPHLPTTLADVAAAEVVNWASIAQQIERLLPLFPPLLAVAFLAKTLFAAMLYAATARAYRGLVATDIASQTERS